MIHPAIIDKLNRERLEHEYRDHRVPLYVPLPEPPRAPPPPRENDNEVDFEIKF